MISPALANGLTQIGEAGVGISDWWIIGSAAATLGGAEGPAPADIDLFGPRASMLNFLRQWRQEERPHAPSNHFRSAPYQRVQFNNCLDIEVMGDLEVFAASRWTPVALSTRVAVKFRGHVLHIPSIDEQIALLRLFGRPKDIARIESIEASRRRF